MPTNWNLIKSLKKKGKKYISLNCLICLKDELPCPVNKHTSCTPYTKIVLGTLKAKNG